ncbi:PilW family protein [Marinobacter gelidimuriae]|uniref:PilW family protein n=1 Tax=Marinobacter gelidimuriae TaxID=2739064 RepID=UPI000363B5C5|nr:PilW family protein [Marinobacter gelidimuriae]
MMNTTTRSAKYPHQAGLSLIELMIALALGLVLTLGVVQIFLGSSKTYRLTDGLALIQENMRFALGNLQYNARMAGHMGCLVGPPENQLDENDSAYDEAIYDINQGAVRGWEASGTGLGSTFTITSLAPSGTWSNGSGDGLPTSITGDIIVGTDVLMIKSGSEADVVLNGNPNGNGNTLGVVDNSNIPQGSILVVVAGDCGVGDLFQTTNALSGTLTKGAGTPGNKTGGADFKGDYDDDGSVFLFASTTYYIGVGASGQPALFRERLDAGDSSGAIELVEGVENMQVLYGVANNIDANPRADTYSPASAVTNWNQVVSVRIALLMRAGDNIIDEPAANTYNLIGTQITTQSDRRARLMGSATVAIRNRLE